MNLKKPIAFWEQVMASITFAEGNEHEIARQLLEKKKYIGMSGHDASTGVKKVVHLANKNSLEDSL